MFVAVTFGHQLSYRYGFHFTLNRKVGVCLDVYYIYRCCILLFLNLRFKEAISFYHKTLALQPDHAISLELLSLAVDDEMFFKNKQNFIYLLFT